MADVAPFTTIPPGDSPGRRVVDLTDMGFPEIPALGLRRSARIGVGSVFHRHKDGIEVTLCVRGSVKFDCEGTVHTLLPGMMFVARPCDKHRIRSNPKGACRYTIFLRFPTDKEQMFLGLPKDEADWLLGRFSSFPHASFMGNALAMVNLGDCYENGDGVPKDIQLAIEYYRKAAQQGNELAIENLKQLEERS